MDSGWFGMLKLKSLQRQKFKAATDIYVAADASNPLVWILNIFNKETKEWETVSMPKSARITSMSVLGIKGDGSVDVGSTEAETTFILQHSWQRYCV